MLARLRFFVSLVALVAGYAGVTTGQTQSNLVKATGPFTGSIIATSDNRVSVGEGDVVILDQGEAQGVKTGDRFLIFQEEYAVLSQRLKQTTRAARQVIGELTIIETAARTSKGLIIDSQFEISTGAMLAPVPTDQGPIMERAGDAEFNSQVNARLARLSPCLEMARQAMAAATAPGVTGESFSQAQAALASAEMALEHANELLAAGKVDRAIGRLDAALTDCFTAQALQGSGATASLAAPERYTVVRGDTLWSISGKEIIYNNPFMWPLIYKANTQQIHDPDVIFPQQILAIPRDYAPAEAAAAIQRAQERRRWRLHDGL